MRVSWRVILAMLQAIAENKELPPNVQIGIGLHIGPLRLAVIGEETRMEIGAYGDTVNTAARIEQHSKETDFALLISASLYDLLPKTLAKLFQSIGDVQMKGQSSARALYGHRADHGRDNVIAFSAARPPHR